MAQFAWTDTPTGVFQNHALSKKVYRAAIADAKVMPFTKTVDGYGKNMGDNVTLKRVPNLSDPTDPALEELKNIPEDEFSMSTTSITVEEIGRAVPFTSKSADLSDVSIPMEVEEALKKQLTTALDVLAIAPFKSTSAKVKAIPTGTAAVTWDTDGTASSAGVANLNYYHVEQIRDKMMDTYHVPGFVGDEYMCLASTKALRGLKQDPKWEEWHKYTDPSAKANGEVGKIENIRFIEVNNTSVLSGTKGTNSVQGEAVFFGADAVAKAMVVPPHLRQAVPSDFGRRRAVAWYGMLAFGVIWDTANAGEARIIHFTSS